MIRRAAAAGTFYERDPVQLRRTLSKLIPLAGRRAAAKAVICPHAGYVYSGRIAGAVLAQVEIPENVVMLGPNHRGQGAPLAVAGQDWETPLGLSALATDLAAAIVGSGRTFSVDDSAHRHEHSLEVLLPFLQHLQDRLRIVPIAVSMLSFKQCCQAAAELVQAIVRHGQPVLLLASTDMSHYESRPTAEAKDQRALEHILRLDPAGLHRTVLSERISMCGVVAVTITLLAALELEAKQAELICRDDSGTASGNLDQVVGYAGLVIR